MTIMKKLREYNQSLKSQGYNLRERMNVYAGTALGIAAPVVAERYFFFPREQDALGEALSWATAIAMNAPMVGIPLIVGGVTGHIVGCIGAGKLRRQRESKLKQLTV